MADRLEDTLKERGATYGPFRNNAIPTQVMTECFRDQKGWRRLSATKRQALDVIAHKIGRILSGDPEYADNWVDIGGYAALIVKEITEQTTARDVAQQEKAIDGYQRESVTGTSTVVDVRDKASLHSLHHEHDHSAARPCHPSCPGFCPRCSPQLGSGVGPRY